MPRVVHALAACALGLLAGGCGNDGGPGGDAATDAGGDAPIDGPVDAPGAFVLTSPVLAEGAMFPLAHTCNGANRSLPLAWDGTPIGTQGFAVLMTDVNTGLIHWAIYDIPVTRTSLPDDVDKTYSPGNVPGAHQARSFNEVVTGYLGPCPPSQHTYRFVLYALDVATLPGTSAETSRVALQALALEHDVASVMLTGTHAQPP